MIEIIATTVKDALEIEAGGANRIELVSCLEVGGLTPSTELIAEVIQAVKIPVHVIIRPHSRSFVYCDDEMIEMKKDIENARMLGASGVVLGVLTSDHTVDTEKLESLLSVCQGLNVTFHRAIDETDVLSSVKVLAKYNEITNILTSGGLAAPVDQNTDVLKQMIEASGHINILLGGGLTMENVVDVAMKTAAKNFHFGSAARTNGEVVKENVELLRNKLKDLPKN